VSGTRALILVASFAVVISLVIALVVFPAKRARETDMAARRDPRDHGARRQPCNLGHHLFPKPLTLAAFDCDRPLPGRKAAPLGQTRYLWANATDPHATTYRRPSILARRISTFARLGTARAQFEHDGRTEVGKIEQIDPADWETTGAVPKVLVVQRH
jgi:hypothetical protein